MPHLQRVAHSLSLLTLAVVLPSPRLAFSQAGSSGRPLAIEDYYRLKNVGAPLMSPDGRWVAFGVTTPVEATNGTDGEVWLVSSDAASQPKRVSADGVNAAGPRWLEDGRLRFVAGGWQFTVDPSEPGRRDSAAV